MNELRGGGITGAQDDISDPAGESGHWSHEVPLPFTRGCACVPQLLVMHIACGAHIRASPRVMSGASGPDSQLNQQTSV